MLKITPLDAPKSVDWTLPASKSHAIRWLQMAALGASSVTLRGGEGLGEDAGSMRRVLEQLGLQVEALDDAWVCSSLPSGFAALPRCFTSETQGPHSGLLQR